MRGSRSSFTVHRSRTENGDVSVDAPAAAARYLPGGAPRAPGGVSARRVVGVGDGPTAYVPGVRAAHGGGARGRRRVAVAPQPAGSSSGGVADIDPTLSPLIPSGAADQVRRMGSRPRGARVALAPQPGAFTVRGRIGADERCSSVGPTDPNGDSTLSPLIPSGAAHMPLNRVPSPSGRDGGQPGRSVQDVDPDGDLHPLAADSLRGGSHAPQPGAFTVGGGIEADRPGRSVRASTPTATPPSRGYSLRGRSQSADERTRTSTGSPPHGPEPCASTSSATSARPRDGTSRRPALRDVTDRSPDARRTPC